MADPSPEAYAEVVDRLLESPRYGESGAGTGSTSSAIAETNSYERDGAKPNAWRYRDYVIRSLNEDKPYDRFVREQLAGDELPDGDSRRDHRHRLLSPGHLGRRAGRPRAGPLRRARRHRRHDRPGLPRPDDQLRPLPRPQDRPDPAEATITASSPSSGTSTTTATAARRRRPIFIVPGSREAYEAGRAGDRAEAGTRSSADIELDRERTALARYREAKARPGRRDLCRRSRGSDVSLLSRHVGPAPRLRRAQARGDRQAARAPVRHGPRHARNRVRLRLRAARSIVPSERGLHVLSRLRRRLAAADRSADPGHVDLTYDGIHGVGRTSARRRSISEPGRVPIRLEYFQRDRRARPAARLVGPRFRAAAASAKTTRPSRCWPVDLPALIRQRRPAAARARPKSPATTNLRRELGAA